MPFNKETDANITISRAHKELLQFIAAQQRRGLRATVELMIENASPNAVTATGVAVEGKGRYVRAYDLLLQDPSIDQAKLDEYVKKHGIRRKSNKQIAQETNQKVVESLSKSEVINARLGDE